MTVWEAGESGHVTNDYCSSRDGGRTQTLFFPNERMVSITTAPTVSSMIVRRFGLKETYFFVSNALLAQSMQSKYFL